MNYRGNYLASAGADHRIRLYDLTRSDVVLAQSYACMVQNSQVEEIIAAQLDSKAHACRIFSLKFHLDEADIFFTGGWDRTVKIWDRRVSGGIVNTIYGPLVCGDGIDLKVYG